MNQIDLAGGNVIVHQLARRVLIKNAALRALIVAEDFHGDGRLARAQDLSAVKSGPAAAALFAWPLLTCEARDEQRRQCQQTERDQLNCFQAKVVHGSSLSSDAAVRIGAVL